MDQLLVALDVSVAALAAGATFLVVGRPIIAAADPLEAAERIRAECHSSQVP